MSSPQDASRPPAETLYEEELAALAVTDKRPRPPGWRLSPRAVRSFIVGCDDPKVSRKFYGDDPLVDRCIVTLASHRGLMLIGEPGTAKSMLSELLAAAISGRSTSTVQGTAGITEDQIKYSWNYARLLAEGPSLQALVPAPLYVGLTEGTIVRFEEITRCQAEVQDTLISVMSDRVLVIPEFTGEDAVCLARKGFNIIATANTRDRGVNEMSSALKRRFNFETVAPIRDAALELELVRAQSRAQLQALDAEVELPLDVLELLVTTFTELREGKTKDGGLVPRPSTVLSTAEAVAVSVAAGLEACYLGEGVVCGEHLARQMTGAVFKDDPEDRKKFRHYVDAVAKPRAENSDAWAAFVRGQVR